MGKLMTPRVAIVTGANKGIGFETVRGLIRSKKFAFVYLTARNSVLGIESREKLAKEEKTEFTATLRFQHLDISDKNSITNFAKFIKDTHGGFDVLSKLVRKKELTDTPLTTKVRYTAGVAFERHFVPRNFSALSIFFKLLYFEV